MAERTLPHNDADDCYSDATDHMEALGYEGERCHSCGARYDEVWATTDELWRDVTGEEEGGGLRCMACFEHDARSLGVSIAWVAVEGTTPRLPVGTAHV